MFFTIITPTIGHPLLKRLLISLNNQTFLNNYSTNDENLFAFEHLIVIDGKNEFSEKTNEQLKEIPPHPKISRQIFELPFNTGKSNNQVFLGHKIYPAITHLMRGEYILFLDDDNIFYPNHLQSFYSILQNKKYQWSFCLRNILHNNIEICQDNCESLGNLHHVFNIPNHFLIDTNCYCIRKDIALESIHIHNRPVLQNLNSPDRAYTNYLLKHYPEFCSTYQYTIGYEVYNNEGQVKKDFFLYGNELMKQKFGTDKPWLNNSHLPKKEIYVLYFDLEKTNELITRFYKKDKDKQSVAFEDWQLNLLDQLDPNIFYLKNGYQYYIPSNSIVLCHMCNPENLPAYVLERNDLIKILYTIESPNIRHQIQWSKEFLEKYFTHVITYWKDLQMLETKLKVFNFPFCHRLSLSYECDKKLIQKNENPIENPSTCIVLENRNFNQMYKINNSILQSQDYLRSEYVKEIPNMYCYGKGWDILNPKNDLYIQHKDPNYFRQTDNLKTKDYYKKHTFSLIIENCNANGYVSEKIYDAWMVSSIPIYYGNFTDEMKEKMGITEDVYIDLKKYSPTEIGAKLRNITRKEIEQYQKNIENKKMEILSKVSIESYNYFLKNILLYEI